MNKECAESSLWLIVAYMSAQNEISLSFSGAVFCFNKPD